MRRLYTFLKYQYNNKALLWIVIMALISLAFTYRDVKVFREMSSHLCAKDMLLVNSYFTFPIYVGISVLKIIIVTYLDDKPNVLIRYNSKESIFLYQCASALITALIDVVIMYSVSVFSAYMMLGVYDTWIDVGSWFYRITLRKKLPVYIGVSDACIYINMIIRKTLIIWLVSIIGLLSEFIFKRLKTVVVIIIMICAISRLSTYGFMRFNLTVVQMYNMPDVIIKTVFLLLICVSLIIAGTFLSKKRQFYK